MKSFKSFVANDNHDAELPEVEHSDVRKKFLYLHNKKNRDAWEERQYHALRDHPSVKSFAPR